MLELVPWTSFVDCRGEGRPSGSIVRSDAHLEVLKAIVVSMSQVGVRGMEKAIEWVSGLTREAASDAMKKKLNDGASPAETGLSDPEDAQR
jgi:hypothetical protein